MALPDTHSIIKNQASSEGAWSRVGHRDRRETKQLKRSAEVIHQVLTNEGVRVSLSSVKRTLDRCGLTKKWNTWKRLHLSTERPEAAQPGDLVEVDTIHLMESEQKRIYVHTLIDVYSR